MGLLTCVEPVPGTREGARFIKKDVTTPFDVQLTVIPSICEVQSPDDIPKGLDVTSVTVQRHYMGSGVRRVPVHSGRIRGMLFLPDGTSRGLEMLPVYCEKFMLK